MSYRESREHIDWSLRALSLFVWGLGVATGVALGRWIGLGTVVWLFVTLLALPIGAAMYWDARRRRRMSHGTDKKKWGWPGWVGGWYAGVPAGMLWVHGVDNTTLLVGALILLLMWALVWRAERKAKSSKLDE